MSKDDAYMLTEVSIPGMDTMGIVDPTIKKICPKCGKAKDKCTCKK